MLLFHEYAEGILEIMSFQLSIYIFHNIKKYLLIKFKLIFNTHNPQELSALSLQL